MSGSTCWGLVDRRGFVWRLLGALAAPAVCWRPPGMEPLTDPTLGISMRFIKAFEPLQFHGDAFALVMEPLSVLDKAMIQLDAETLERYYQAWKDQQSPAVFTELAAELDWTEFDRRLGEL